MSHIFSYSKELASHTQDPKERAAAIITGRGVVRPVNFESINPRTRSLPVKNLDVTVPLSYLVISRIKELLRKR